MSWINDLIANYHTQIVDKDGKVKPAYAQRARILQRLFGGRGASVLSAAVDQYILEQKFFPSAAEFRPYIQIAEEQSRGQWPDEQINPIMMIRAMTNAERMTLDEQILAWEQSRGTMPGNEQLDTEYLESEFYGQQPTHPTAKPAMWAMQAALPTHPTRQRLAA